MDSILQKDKRCYFCGAREGLHRHHIFCGTGRRWQSETHGFVVYLCAAHHNGSEFGVHFNKALDLKLRRDCQKKFEETHTRDEFMRLIGRNYLGKNANMG